jgi:hypothetical protein
VLERRVRSAILFVCIAVAATASAAGCGGTSEAQTKSLPAVSAAASATAVASREAPSSGTAKKWHNPYAGPVSRITPGRVFKHGGVLPGEIQNPVTGGWEVGSHTLQTDVWAGADGRDRSVGSFEIMRTSPIHVTQKVDSVKVPGSGPLTITKAPLGRRIVVSAQRHGHIEFTSKYGISGTLSLRDDTVSLNR